MKKQDAKVGMRVVVTGINDVGAHKLEGYERYLEKGDVVTIIETEIGFRDRFQYRMNKGDTQTFPYSEVEPFQEKVQMKTNWYSRISTEMGVALYELAKKNGHEFHSCFRTTPFYHGKDKGLTAILMRPTGLEFCYSFSGWEKGYQEIPLDEAVKILLVPQTKPLTAGGKLVSLTEKGIKVDNVEIVREVLTKAYKRFKEGPIVANGVGIVDYVTADSKTYCAIKLGCTTASAEEVEAIAKELKL